MPALIEFGAIIVGIFLGIVWFTAIILPVFYGFPRAVYWAAKGWVRWRGPARYLLSPIVWTVIFFAIAFGLTAFMPVVSRYLMESGGFALGQVLGILLSLGRAIFSEETRTDMRIDFDNFMRPDLTSTAAQHIGLPLRQESETRLHPVKSLLGRKPEPWDSFPSEFIEKLKMEIGDGKFHQLTEIGKKHGMFAQKAFQDPRGAGFFDDTPDPGGGPGWTFGKLFFSTFLGTMASALGKTEREDCIQDALVVLDIALCILPENPFVRSTMALLCSCFSGLQDEARKHARLALQNMAAYPTILSQPAASQVRDQMTEIINGTYLKK